MFAPTEGQLTALVTLLAAVVGGAVAFVAALLTNRANAGSAKAAREHETALRTQDLIRSRGEELYTLLQGWRNRLHGYYIVKLSVMSGKLTYNQGLDLEIADGRGAADRQHLRIEMLIDVYFPEVRQDYDQMITHRDAASIVISEHKEKYRVGQIDGKSFAPRLIEELERLDLAAEELNEKLVHCLRAA